LIIDSAAAQHSKRYLTLQNNENAVDEDSFSYNTGQSKLVFAIEILTKSLLDLNLRRIKDMGKNYYVSSKIGSDQSSGASSQTPFASLQKAADTAGAGDTILVMPGSYRNSDPNQNLLRIAKSGTATAPITFKAFDPSNKPVLNVRNYSGVLVLGSYINIDGFVIAGNRSEFDKMTVAQVDAIQKKDGRYSSPITSGDGILIGSFYDNKFASHVKVTNSIIRDNTGGGIGVLRGDYITIENNQVYRNAFYTPYAASGISFYQSANSDNNTGVKMIVRGNTVYGNKNLIKNYINYSEADINSPNLDKRPRITDGNGIIIDDGARTQIQDIDGKKAIKDLPAYKGKTLIEDNNVFGNGGRGIHAFNSANVEIRNNQVANNLLSPEIKDGEIISYITEEAKLKGAGQGISISGDNVISAVGLPTKAIFGIENGRPTVELRGTSNSEKLIPALLPVGQSYKYIGIFGEGGNDTLTGSSSTDVNDIFGEEGNDILNAGKASSYNYMVGGTGNDTLNFDVSKTVMDIAVYNAGDGQDTITRFTRGIGNDQIFFNRIPNVDVISRAGNTEFHIGDGIAGNSGFGSGALLIKTVGTIGFNANDVGINLLDSSFKFS
jgi:parallel beta-helix repeat protein